MCLATANTMHYVGGRGWHMTAGGSPALGGFAFGPYWGEGWQGVASIGWGISKGLLNPEPRSAPILLRAFFKGSQVITPGRDGPN